MKSTHRSAVNSRHTPLIHAPGFWCSWRTVCRVHMLHKHCMASDVTQLRERAAFPTSTIYPLAG
jgi:hypothetical protein